MTKTLHLCILALAFVGREAATAEKVEDETCLLQTQISTETGRKREVESASVFHHSPRHVPQFEIDLDSPPQERFSAIAKHYKGEYTKFYNKFATDSMQQATAKKMSLMRGPENDEFQGEIDGIAKVLDVPEYYVHAQQLSVPLNSVRGAFLNFVDSMDIKLPTNQHEHSSEPGLTELLDEFSIPSFGSTGIIAKDSDDGTVWHARNLGYAMPKYLQKFTYNALFTKGGKKLYTAQMVFPTVLVLTGLRSGSNGYSYQLNSRYVDNNYDSLQVTHNLYKKHRQLGGWNARKVLEGIDNYDDAKKAFTAAELPNPQFDVITGVEDKGAVIARDPDSVAYTMELDEEHPYIVIENFDYAKHDKKELLELKGDEGINRRARAQELLESGDAITPALLQRVLNDKDVITNNVYYQALMNAGKDIYRSNLPQCATCE